MSFTKLYFFILTFQKPTIYNDPNAFNSGIPFLSILMEHRQFSNSRYSLFNRDDQVAFVEILGRPQECKTLPHRENRQEIYRQPLVLTTLLTQELLVLVFNPSGRKWTYL